MAMLAWALSCLVSSAAAINAPRNVHPIWTAERAANHTRNHTGNHTGNHMGHAGAYPVGINYYGGPVMVGQVTVHLLFYGTWTARQQDIVQTFIRDFSTMVDLKSTPGKWFDLEKTYSSDGTLSGRFSTGPVVLGRSVFDNYSRGRNLGENDAWPLISAQIASGALPRSGDALYFLLTAQDVSYGNFCAEYCGWHTYGTQSGVSIKFGFVGNAGHCNSCGAAAVSPNGDPGVDATLSVLAHEIVEAMSDPEISAYADDNGAENADKCSWDYGKTNTQADGSRYNLVATGTSNRKYLIQQNWNALTGGCDTSASSTTPPPPPASCATGYSLIPGDIVGGGSEGTIQVTSSQQCADRCSAMASCNSYEFYAADGTCNLNAQAQPNGPQWLDQAFCVKVARSPSQRRSPSPVGRARSPSRSRSRSRSRSPKTGTRMPRREAVVMEDAPLPSYMVMTLAGVAALVAIGAVAALVAIKHKQQMTEDVLNCVDVEASADHMELVDVSIAPSPSVA